MQACADEFLATRSTFGVTQQHEALCDKDTYEPRRVVEGQGHFVKCL